MGDRIFLGRNCSRWRPCRLDTVFPYIFHCYELKTFDSWDCFHFSGCQRARRISLPARVIFITLFWMNEETVWLGAFWSRLVILLLLLFERRRFRCGSVVSMGLFMPKIWKFRWRATSLRYNQTWMEQGEQKSLLEISFSSKCPVCTYNCTNAEEMIGKYSEYQLVKSLKGIDTKNIFKCKRRRRQCRVMNLCTLATNNDMLSTGLCGVLAGRRTAKYSARGSSMSQTSSSEQLSHSNFKVSTWICCTLMHMVRGARASDTNTIPDWHWQ